jgi:hypothetical protein
MRSRDQAPVRRTLPAVGVFLLTLLVAFAAAPVALAAPPPPSAAAGDVFYSPQATAPQAQSPEAMRAFLSTDHPEYTLQSYVWAGSLVEDDGGLSTFACEIQRNPKAIDGTAQLPVVTSAALFNRRSSPGYAVGALVGVPELTLPFTLTTLPWSVRAQSFSLGQQPQFIDVRVVDGVIGKKGAVYEFTTSITNGAEGAPSGQLLTLYVRARDATGLMQWGYGPSGFFPQWIYPDQRAAITGEYGDSVGGYLAATHDPMTNQGDYYYTLPLLEVQRFSVSLGDQVVSRGSSGWLWFDNVVQQFDAAAEQVISSGVTWMEFSVQFPRTKQAMKIGYVKQASVGQLDYAMLHDPDSPKARNGSFMDSVSWGIDDVHITPVPSSLWKSPASGQSYYTRYTVTLDGARPRDRAKLFIAARFQDQEVDADQRTVYEGLFSVTGTLCGKKVTGQAWTEVQPTADL